MFFGFFFVLSSLFSTLSIANSNIVVVTFVEIIHYHDYYVVYVVRNDWIFFFIFITIVMIGDVRLMMIIIIIMMLMAMANWTKQKQDKLNEKSWPFYCHLWTERWFTVNHNSLNQFFFSFHHHCRQFFFEFFLIFSFYFYHIFSSTVKKNGTKWYKSF